MNTISSRIAPPPLVSPSESSKAAEYLNSTRDGLLNTVNGLSDSQWHFKPAPDRWSIAEILEHIVLIEDRVHTIIARMQDAPATEPDRMDSQIDEIILRVVPNRSSRVEAPPYVSPIHRWSPAETLARFVESRARTAGLLAEAPSLRGHVAPHPVLGLWDGYQWILAAAAHSARHTDQMLEVKACAEFPRNTVSPAPLH